MISSDHSSFTCIPPEHAYLNTTTLTSSSSITHTPHEQNTHFQLKSKPRASSQLRADILQRGKKILNGCIKFDNELHNFYLLAETDFSLTGSLVKDRILHRHNSFSSGNQKIALYGIYNHLTHTHTLSLTHTHTHTLSHSHSSLDSLSLTLSHSRSQTFSAQSCCHTVMECAVVSRYPPFPAQQHSLVSEWAQVSRCLHPFLFLPWLLPPLLPLTQTAEVWAERVGGALAGTFLFSAFKWPSTSAMKTEKSDVETQSVSDCESGYLCVTFSLCPSL